MRDPKRSQPVALVAAMVEAGLSDDAARAAIDAVFAALPAAMVASRSIYIAGIGKLAAPQKRVYVPGSVDKLARDQRKVVLRESAIIWKSEAWDVSWNKP